MIPVGQTLKVKDGIEERETDYTVWRRCWKHWGGLRAAAGHTCSALMDVLFAHSIEEQSYKAKMGELIGRLGAENWVLTEMSLSL